MATSPAPDAAAPPGMCPGALVLGGGMDDGGGKGKAKGGKNGKGGDGKGDGEGADGDGKEAQGAPDYEKYPGCGYASHPVDVVTGRAFTHPIVDLELPGPMPLVFRRMYSSKMAARDTGLGYGWGHTFGWEIELGRQGIRIWNEQGIAVDFPMIDVGTELIGPWGWVLRREAWGFIVDADDGVWRHFALTTDGKKYRLTSWEDRNKNKVELSYEGDKLIGVRDCVGRMIRVASTREGRIASIRVRNAISQGQWIAFGTYEYDERGNMVSATDADGYVAKYEYDDAHRLTADTDRVGLTFHFVYDDVGRCIESWGDYGGKTDPSLAEGLPDKLADGVTKAKGVHHCKFSYFENRYSEVADSTQVRRFFGTKHGTLAKEVEGSAVTTSTYSDDGHMVSRTDALGATTTFERDGRGRLLKVTDPLGRVTRIERNAQGLPVAAIDAAEGVTRIQRDARGNGLRIVDPTEAIDSFGFDARGLLTESVSAMGGRVTFLYDDFGNLVTVMQPNGGIWKYTYDALGRLLTIVDPLNAETHYSYSNRGDLVSVRDALGNVTRYAYDGEGHLVQVVDPLGNITYLVWGGYHRLCSRKDANGHDVRLCYNWEGELIQVYNEHGEVHRLHYDGTGKLIGETTFDGRELRYENDLVGRTIRVMNGLREPTEIEYDAAGQLIRRGLSDGTADIFEYNKRGELIGATNEAGSFRFERDALGRIVREEQSVGGQTHWVDVALDQSGERIRRETSLGHSEVVTRGLLGERARTVLDRSHVVEHRADILGREVGRGLRGGGWLQHQYDPLGRITRRQAGASGSEQSNHRGPATTVDKAYRYDPRGELVESWDQAHGRTQYAYDPVGQLLSMVPEKARAEFFRYDRAGNLSENEPGIPERVYGRGNRLLRKGDTEYLWDDDGRLIEKRNRNDSSETEEVWRYEWNAAGLLKEVERPDGMRVGFTYDPFARRLSKRVTCQGETLVDRIAVSETRFVWDGDVLAHEIKTAAELAGDPVVEERTYWFEDDDFEPLAHKEKEAWFHYVNDPIGTPERLIAENGDVACELQRKAWGQTEESPGGTASTKIRFQGQYEDEETGLRYNRFRYYDAEDGRFVSADPLRLFAGLQAFGYGLNPTGSTDPLGLDWVYRLVNEEGEVYYVGRANDNATKQDIERRHAQTMGKGDKGKRRFETGSDEVEVVAGDLSKDEARALEQAGIDEYKTNIGRRKCNGDKTRGNNIRGVSEKKWKKKYKDIAKKFLNGRTVSQLSTG